MSPGARVRIAQSHYARHLPSVLPEWLDELLVYLLFQHTETNFDVEFVITPALREGGTGGLSPEAWTEAAIALATLRDEVYQDEDGWVQIRNT